MTIRKSTDEDLTAIRALHLEAFGPEENKEVSALAIDLLDDPTAEPLLSLVAVRDGDILGHILFTAVHVIDGKRSVSGQILAPLGVMPGAQGMGIGGDLIRDGLERLRADGVGLVFVLGHPGYYPRFGFEPAGKLGLAAPYPIPEEVSDAWMVQELNPGYLGKVRGVVRCSELLDQPEHWVE